MTLEQNKLKINWLTFSVLVFYPIFLLALLFVYGKTVTIGWFEIGLMIAGYYGSNISVGVGLHRLWSHGAFKVRRIVEIILVFMTAGTLQGPILAWASDHYKHHTYTDEELDPHTPLRYKNRFLGFLWSHMGWMIFSESSHKKIDRTTMHKLGKNKLLVWQLQNYWSLAVLMNTVVPAMVGYLIGGDLQSLFAGYLFIGLGRALQQQATFCVNSVCHFVGTRKYTAGTARDIWWLFFMLLGENWHNFHHAFARDYRNGVKWYHLDIHKWIIWGMEKLGLAYDLVRTSEERIRAKVQETASILSQDVVTRFAAIESRASMISQMIMAQLEKADKSQEILTQKVVDSLQSLEAKARQLSDSARQIINQQAKASERLLQKASEKLKSLENDLKRFGIITQSA
jgi:stearoyl-CoA desaturase (delta-9 desaturase)